MWNSLELQCPDGDMVAYPPQDHYIMEELRDFVTVLTTAADTLTAESPLWNEINVLRNIQVKYKRILRCDRFLIFLQRVGHCLRKMVLLNLSKSYLDLAERFLVGFQDTSGTPHLPSRQQVEYILIRTLSSIRLVCEAITYSRESFCYLIQKIKVGHLILDLIMATSIIARLNILLRATLDKLSSMYKQVLHWRYKIKKGEFQWAQKFDFPQDVEEWIKRFEPAHLKPLSMSQQDIHRVKLMLNQTSSINREIDVSDSDSVTVLDEKKVNSPAADDDDVTITKEGYLDDDDVIIETDYGEVIPRKKPEGHQKLVQNEKRKSGENLLKIKEPKHNLTTLQKSLLRKIKDVQSLKDLENLWCKMKDMPQDRFPKILTAKKTTVIDKLFLQMKSNCPQKKYNKIFQNKPNFLQTAILHFSKRLGFIKDHINMTCNMTDVPESASSDERPLVPVKSLKKLKLLCKQLKEILMLNGETEKLQLLSTVFKHRIIDIKNLKKNGEKLLAKKLISCTSKEFLALLPK